MRSHYLAVKTRLLAEPTLAGKVHDSALVESGGLPVVASYAILFGGAPDLLASNRFTAPQSIDSDAEYAYTVRSVAPSPEGVRSVQASVAAQLTGHVLVVAGRSCSRMRLTDATDPGRHNSASVVLFFADQEFTVNSYPL